MLLPKPATPVSRGFLITLVGVNGIPIPQHAGSKRCFNGTRESSIENAHKFVCCEHIYEYGNDVTNMLSIFMRHMWQNV